jgi:hypothetical protein
MSNTLVAQGTVTVSVPAGGSIAIFSLGSVTVSRNLATANFPTRVVPVGTVAPNIQSVFGPFTPATEIVIDASGGFQVLYEVGTNPVVQQFRLLSPVQVAPATLDATGTLTGQLCLTGIVTSTTAAAVTATLDTGAALDPKSLWNVNDSFDWAVINTGGTNAFTVTAAASGHTLVGSGTVALSTSAQFRTRKTAAATFVTYRLG